MCVIITRSAWNHCQQGSNYCQRGSNGLTGSRRPQDHLRSCCCTRAYARVISWQNDRLGQYKQVPSLSGAIPSSPNSAPGLASCNRAHTTSSWNAIFSFLRFAANSHCFDYLYVRFVALAQWLERCAIQSGDCRFWSKRCAFALVARLRPRERANPF